MTLGEALEEASLFLRQHKHENGSAQQYWLRLFDHNLNNLVAQLKEPMNESDYQYYKESLKKIIQDQPIEYIKGKADFMGESYRVTKDTLIPRPETEGLVHLVEKYYNSIKPQRLLDLGTGSGVIAIATKLLFPDIEVFASDISKPALDVAQINAVNHKVSIQFLESNLFENFENIQFDIIVSNPPYIAIEEVPLMDQSVIEHEPHLALFTDNQGLDFYQKIARQVGPYLTDEGLILLEIGFKQGPAVKSIFQNIFPQAKIRIEKDYNQLDRYIIVELKG